MAEPMETEPAGRPTRERKGTQFFTVKAEKKEPEKLEIKEGKGTKLGDIPNVVFQLNKFKGNDEFLKMVHSLLFRKPGKAIKVKSNIREFSGFTYDNPEAEREKNKEKMLKFTVAGLHQLLELFDLPRSVEGMDTKKETQMDRILDFLDKPVAREGSKDLQAAAEKEKEKRKKKAEKVSAKKEKDAAKKEKEQAKREKELAKKEKELKARAKDLKKAKKDAKKEDKAESKLSKKEAELERRAKELERMEAELNRKEAELGAKRKSAGEPGSAKKKAKKAKEPEPEEASEPEDEAPEPEAEAESGAESGDEGEAEAEAEDAEEEAEASRKEEEE